MEQTTIGEAPDNALVRVEGTIRAIEPPLTSPLDGAPCVFFEVRQGLFDSRPGAQLDRDAQNFLVEQGDHAALVVMEQFEVRTLSSQAWQQSLSLLDGDINDVAARLRELKRTMRESGAAARLLLDELHQYRALATYLCALRAHARGRIHVADCKTLAAQAEYLRQRRQIYEARRTNPDQPQLPVMRWVGSLREGQRVVVEGFARREPDLDPMAGGYRDRPTRLTIRAPSDGHLIVYASGSAQPAAREAKEATAAQKRPSPERRAERWERFFWIVAVGAAAVGTLASLLWP